MNKQGSLFGDLLRSDLETEAGLFLSPRNRRQLEEVTTDDQLDASKWLSRPPH